MRTYIEASQWHLLSGVSSLWNHVKCLIYLKYWPIAWHFPCDARRQCTGWVSAVVWTKVHPLQEYLGLVLRTIGGSEITFLPSSLDQWKKWITRLRMSGWVCSRSAWRQWPCYCYLRMSQVTHQSHIVGTRTLTVSIDIGWIYYWMGWAIDYAVLLSVYADHMPVYLTTTALV